MNTYESLRKSHKVFLKFCQVLLRVVDFFLFVDPSHDFTDLCHCTSKRCMICVIGGCSFGEILSFENVSDEEKEEQEAVAEAEQGQVEREGK